MYTMCMAVGNTCAIDDLGLFATHGIYKFVWIALLRSWPPVASCSLWQKVDAAADRGQSYILAFALLSLCVRNQR